MPIVKKLKSCLKQILSLFIADFNPTEWMILKETPAEIYMINRVTGNWQIFKREELDRRDKLA